MKRLILLVCLTFATVFQASMVPVSAQGGYTLTEIGAGYLVSGMNSLGEVVGWGGQGWFIWSREAGFIVDEPAGDAPKIPGRNLVQPQSPEYQCRRGRGRNRSRSRFRE